MGLKFQQKYYSQESGLQLQKSNAMWKSSDNCSLFVKTICRDRVDYDARHLNFLAADSR